VSGATSRGEPGPNAGGAVDAVVEVVPPSEAEARIHVGDGAAGGAGSRALVRTEEDGWLGRLAGGVVHELKNPLSTIHLNLELLREEWGRAWAHSDDPKERRSLKRIDVILGETRRLEAMMREFLRFARADRLQPTDVDLAALVEEVMAFVAPECALRRVEVRRETDATLPPIPADAGLVKQAVLNLVQNALDAITMKAAEDAAHETITVRVARDPGGAAARIEVSDTGVGIGAADQARIFELYRTTKADGTGLGLATTKRIAEAHGGRLEVESAGEGQGSRFSLVLPLAGPQGELPCDAPT